MKIERDIESFGVCEERRKERIVEKTSLDRPVDQGALEAKLFDRVFKLHRSRIGIGHRQRGEASEALRVTSNCRGDSSFTSRHSGIARVGSRISGEGCVCDSTCKSMPALSMSAMRRSPKSPRFTSRCCAICLPAEFMDRK